MSTELDLYSIPIFTGLSKNAVNNALKLSTTVRFPRGALIIKENEPTDELYIILSGKVTIITSGNTGEAADEHYSTTMLTSGNVVGELSFIDDKTRSARVVAATECELIVIEKNAITPKSFGDEFSSFFKNIAKIAATRLRATTQREAKHYKEQLLEKRKRLDIGQLLIYVVLSLSIYTFSLPLIRTLDLHIGHSIISSLIILILACLYYYLIMRSPLPRSAFGLTLKNAKKNIISALKYSIPILIFTVCAKILLIHIYHPVNVSVFSFNHGFSHHYGISQYIFTLCLYALFVFPQEVVARCALQSMLSNYLYGEVQSKWLPILQSNLMFAALHIHKSFFFSVISFFTGLFWGWLYAKQKSVVGVTVSHIAIGVFAIFMVGFMHIPFTIDF